MKQDYPKKIFLAHNPNGEIGDTWHARLAELDDAEYTRSDLVPKWKKITDAMPPTDVDLMFVLVRSQHVDSKGKVRPILRFRYPGWYDSVDKMFHYHRLGERTTTLVSPSEVEKYFVIPED